MGSPQFYQEFCDVGKMRPTGNVVVVYPETRHCVAGQVVYEGLGRISPNILSTETSIAPNQFVTHWKVDRVWLQQCCVQISEKSARQIHPRLFESCMDAELRERRKANRQHAAYWLCAVFLGGLSVGSVRSLVRRGNG